ncbi:MAG: FG-GAP repeat protein [Chitinophagaceae bacterium]|nr:FG-GAP repeat protein [Chitinophagaceae bacterium]
MYKIFTLAAMVAVLPVSQKSPAYRFSVSNITEIPVSILPHIQPPTANFWDPEKKTEQFWSQSWMEMVQENILKSEYHFTWEEKLNAYCTPNRKNNLRFFYQEDGFSVEPRTTKIPIAEFNPIPGQDKIKYRTIPEWKVKFRLDKKQFGKGFWKVSENIAEYVTNKITVQYLNNKSGMRQNFIVHSPFSKKEALKLNFRVNTKLKTVVYKNRLQFLHKRNAVLNYDDLKVWDANHKPLEASFKKNNRNGYTIKVNTTSAIYPITIDPISTTPAAQVESNNVSARMGASVSSAGDVNGDGYSDVVVGAYFYNNGQSAEGAFYVFLGSATGINTTPATMIESNIVSTQLGYSVASAGDVNGDGYSDIIVGAPLYSNGETNEGAFYIYHGSPSGINTSPTTTVESNGISYKMGWSVASAGDINGDGYSDVIVGVAGYTNTLSGQGAAFVYYGSASGINTAVVAKIEGPQSNIRFAWSVASAGDVNGDGYSDIIVGASLYTNLQSSEGAFFIYHGSAAGINTTAAAMAESNQASALLGYSVASAGDVNGDGYSDIIVGAGQYTNGQSLEGAAFIYHGSATGINTIAAAMVESNLVNAFLGTSVSCVGDINGDGYSDVAAGGWNYSNGQSSEGAIFVYLGSAGGINTTATAIIESNLVNAGLGTVASAGDVNGDGYSDIIAGASSYSNGESSEGAAFVYHGSAAGINTTSAASVESDQANALMGYSVAGAGDVNGDGYCDVIVGAYQYDNGQTDEGAAFIYHGSATGINTVAAAILESNQASALFGRSVAGAGDVNGDGYKDVIVGADGFTNGQASEGAAFIYHGSAAGVSTTAAAILESNQANAKMGISVAGAGDVNDDGYGDVIAGAYQYTNGQTSEGAAFIYRGTATGINTTVSAIVESNQVNAFMGISVSGAGDVNGDGYNDVIVGAYQYDNGQADEGAAFIYHGSATGINTTVAATVESNQASAFMGISVAGAGDVNGDGYGDVFVGAWLYDNGQTDEGAAFIYHGSATGINTTAAAMVESNLANASLGSSVANAGDLNGDGYSDIIVGAYTYTNGQANEGAIFIYYGSAAGINTTATVIESNLAGAILGFSVASAGDVNGDGYSDVIAGAYHFTNGQTNEGSFYIYLGNSPGTNKRNNLRLYNSDLTTPINKNNFVFGNFGAGLFVKSFLGKAKAKMVWETRLNYNAYSGTPITNSTLFTAQQGAYTSLGLSGAELKNLVNKLMGGGRYTKLRARVKYDPVTAITGQVYGPWRNVSAIIDGNSLGALPIELISFSAAWHQKGKTARLDFKTDKESGVCCFEIEKSEDGFTFYKIGTLPAKNISGIQSYSFIDGNATGKKQFYRIKVKGFSGQIDYSNIQQLQYNGTTEILVFPNPTTDVLRLELNGTYDKINVQIINTAGLLVKQLYGVSASGRLITIPVQNLPAGHYWLRIEGGNAKQVLQFAKQ